MRTVLLGFLMLGILCHVAGCAKNPQKHFNAGDQYFDQGLYAKAIEEYQQAVKIKPDWALAHNNLGLAYAKAQQLESAIREYNEAIKLDPKIAEAYYNLASIYYDRRAFPQAILHYKKALEINPRLAEAHHNLGAAYYETKQYESAWKEALEAQKLGFDTKNLVEALNSVSPRPR
jgi:tetratricopeptide (TPR) repeat protein